MLSIMRIAVLAIVSTSVVLARPPSLVEHSDMVGGKSAEVGTGPGEFLRTTPVSPSTLEGHQSSLPNATVTLCTGPHFTGQCYNSTWPVNECIDLHGYAHNTQTFIPLPSSSCLLTQGRCDVGKPYASFDSADFTPGSNSTVAQKAEDLRTYYPWAGEVNSYICFAEMEDLSRFVRLSMARVASPL